MGKKDGSVRGEQWRVERRYTIEGLETKLACAGAEQLEPVEAYEELDAAVKTRNCWNSQYCPNLSAV